VDINAKLISLQSLTITSKSARYSDSEIKVEKEDIELATLPLRIHKPESVVLNKSGVLYTPSGCVGEGVDYFYNILDLQYRVIPNLEGYRIYERLHIDRNEDGFGGAWDSNITSQINCRPYPGVIFESSQYICDRVATWIDDDTTTNEDDDNCLDSDAIVQWHNSFYIMENIYLKGSTTRYTWTPIIEGENVVDLKFEKTKLNDSQKVTQANDDID